MKKKLTIMQKEVLNKGIIGLLWVSIGVFNVFQFSQGFKLAVSIILVVAGSLMFLPYFLKSDKEDEMAVYNQNKAKASVYRILTIGIVVITFLSIWKSSWIVDLKIIMPFLLGGSCLIETLFFVLFEKVGVE